MIHVKQDIDFSFSTWNSMVIEASNSRRTKTPKHICRVMYPGEVFKIELKTDQQIKHHFSTYGYWDSNCRKMFCKEILNLTRISVLNEKPVLPLNLRNALKRIAQKSDNHYAGFLGRVRRTLSAFFNLFTTDTQSLFFTTRVYVMDRNGRTTSLDYWE